MKDWLKHNVSTSYLKSKLGVSETNCCSKCGRWVSDKTVEWSKVHDAKIICYKCNKRLRNKSIKIEPSQKKLIYSLLLTCNDCGHSTELTNEEAIDNLHIDISKQDYLKIGKFDNLYCKSCKSKDFKIKRLIDSE